MDKRYLLHVGGTLFSIKIDLINRHPDTLLGSISTVSEFYNEDDNCFYFDRNPELFNTILDFYRNGEIHLPTNICGWMWKKEFEFWKIPTSAIPECCFPVIANYDDNAKVADEVKAATRPTEPIKIESLTRYKKMQLRIWLFLEEPSSSVFARVFSVIYLVIVALSTLIPCLTTHPDLRTDIVNKTYFMSYISYYNLDTWVKFDNQKEILLVTTHAASWVEDLNMFVIVFFSMDIIFRSLTTPSKLNFFCNWLNILDIILFVGMWTNYGIYRNFHEDMLTKRRLAYFFYFTEVLAVFRLFRFFRLAKQYKNLKVLYLALKASLKELLLLFVTFLALAWLFANLIYFAELLQIGTFPNILIGLWWAVITMTTVGYGDEYPTGTVGRIVGVVCAMCGLIVLAMPIAVIAGNFSDLYRKNQEIESYKKHQKVSNVSQAKIAPSDEKNNGMMIVNKGKLASMKA